MNNGNRTHIIVETVGVHVSAARVLVATRVVTTGATRRPANQERATHVYSVDGHYENGHEEEDGHRTAGYGVDRRSDQIVLECQLCHRFGGRCPSTMTTKIER